MHEIELWRVTVPCAGRGQAAPLDLSIVVRERSTARVIWLRPVVHCKITAHARLLHACFSRSAFSKYLLNCADEMFEICVQYSESPTVWKFTLLTYVFCTLSSNSGETFIQYIILISLVLLFAGRSHLAIWQQISDGLKDEFHIQRTARACHDCWMKIEKSRVAKEAARNEAHEAPTPQTAPIGARKPPPRHTHSSASGHNEGRSQQLHAALLAKVVPVNWTNHVSFEGLK